MLKTTLKYAVISFLLFFQAQGHSLPTESEEGCRATSMVTILPLEEDLGYDGDDDRTPRKPEAVSPGAQETDPAEPQGN